MSAPGLGPREQCPRCGLAVPPGELVCPRDGTDLRPPARPEELLGARVGEYEVVRVLGLGGMGVVYEGREPLIDRRVAIKVLRPEFAHEPAQVRRFLEEARAVNAIHHRSIVDIFGFGQLPNDGRHYMVMEFLEGRTLDAFLEDGPLSLDFATALLLEVLEALAAAHAAGVVHRDLKPANLFVVEPPDGRRYAKLLDFGLAKNLHPPSDLPKLTRPMTVMGTPEFMAPEQALAAELTPAADLYALGVVAFQMLTGRLPYVGETPVETMRLQVGSAVPSVRALRPEVPPALDAWVAKLMAKSPSQRPASAQAARDKLARLRAGLKLGPGATSLADVSRLPTAVALEPSTQPVVAAVRPPVGRGRFGVPRWLLGALALLGAALLGALLAANS